MAALTELQQDVLRRFFAVRHDFFLTGGAALTGFHLHHRATHDLDLFTTVDVLDDGERTLSGIAHDLTVEMETVRRSSTFRRFILKSPQEGLIVDLVRDEVPQVLDKVAFGSIIVDSLEEILANKLCALLSRTEVRDLVDVVTIAAAGHDPVAAMSLAQRKDAGATPAQLAWVLSTFPIPEDALVHGFAREPLIAFRDRFVQQLAACAFPKS
jgi:predicted nucleotidyltransferase component of viral defense system